MSAALTRNIALYRWSRFLRNLLFWQAIWFLYFQDTLSASEAILLYAVYDVATTLLEVPSGYMSDRVGRRFTLISGAACSAVGTALLVAGDSFAVFALAQTLLGAGAALASGTDEAMLYESLEGTGREDEIEGQEVVAWRYSYIALALSAVSGGFMALVDPRLPFAVGVVAMLALVWVTWLMVEPPRTSDVPEGSELVRARHLRDSFRNPVLLWIFALSVVMYGFSHLPFVFGQPFILEALGRLDLSASAPWVSGLVTATMMGVSVLVSLFATRLRAALGLPMLLLGSFAIQIGIAGAMAATDSLAVIAFLLLRMVPDALSRPFILGRIQPLLDDDSRATFLSLKSFAGRLLFASALSLGAINTNTVGSMSYDEISGLLSVATLIGLAILAVLAFSARRIGIEPQKPDHR